MITRRSPERPQTRQDGTKLAAAFTPILGNGGDKGCGKVSAIVDNGELLKGSCRTKDCAAAENDCGYGSNAFSSMSKSSVGIYRASSQKAY